MVKYCKLINVFQTFSCKIRYPNVFSGSGIKVMEYFSVISHVAVATLIATYHSGVDFFLKGIFEMK